MSSLDSHRVSSSEDCSSEDSNSSSSTGPSSPGFIPGQVPNSYVSKPQPLRSTMSRPPVTPTMNHGRNGKSGSELPVISHSPPTIPLISLPTLKWNDHLLNHEYTVPASSPDLEASLEILLRGDPLTGRKLHYGSWVWRVESGGEGTSQAHEAAGRGVPSPGNTAEAEGNSHPDMEFEEFTIPDDQPAGETGGSQGASAKTFTVQPETVEIHDEEEPEDDRSKGKGKEKAGRRTKKVATTHPSFSKKRQRADPDTASQSVEEDFINLGLRLKEVS
ncbi:unnamed protein product [Cuscuta campestris]|uniref:Uncharacterized protein n=1 Tax=Cuscuta campestris TaxID=132261 RepID=A0A484NFM4_9ASTE|nr:unnamed protein product [Cuscuta campestris]